MSGRRRSRSVSTGLKSPHLVPVPPSPVPLPVFYEKDDADQPAPTQRLSRGLSHGTGLAAPRRSEASSRSGRASAPLCERSVPSLLPLYCPFRHLVTAEVAAGAVSESLSGGMPVEVIDCRFPFEFEGGHIKGARNLWQPEQLIRHFFLSRSRGALEEQAQRVVLFHCEFSSQRAPDQFAMLRTVEHELHMQRFGNVDTYFPHAMIIKGGYKEFYTNFPEHCEGSYRPMDLSSYAAEVKRCTAVVRTQTREYDRRKPTLANILCQVEAAQKALVDGAGSAAGEA